MVEVVVIIAGIVVLGIVVFVVNAIRSQRSVARTVATHLASGKQAATELPPEEPSRLNGERARKANQDAFERASADERKRAAENMRRHQETLKRR